MGAAVKKQLFNTVSTNNQYCIKITQHVLIETKQYLVMIKLLMFMPNLTCVNFAELVNICRLTFTSRTASLKNVSDKVPSAK